MSNRVFIGTELKLNLYFEPIGNTRMRDYSFKVEAYCTTPEKGIEIDDDNIKIIDDNNCNILINTIDVGVGTLKLKVTASIPDLDFKDDNSRTEVVCVNTGIKIVDDL